YIYMGKFNSLKDKVIVITGGAKNLGGLLSTEYAKDGAKLVIHHHDEKSLDDAKDTLSKVEKLGGEATLFSGDLTKVSNIEALFQHAEKTFGKVDIAINTVGKVLKKPIAEKTEEEFDSMADINSKSAYFFIKYAEKSMNNDGKIITLATSLLAAYTGLYSTYAGEKAPVEHYTRAASNEFIARGIYVNAVASSPNDTLFLDT